MLKAATIAVAVVAALAMASPASSRTLAQTAALQRSVIRHDKSVIATWRFVRAVNRGKKPVTPTVWKLTGPSYLEYRFHRAQLRWTRRELRETLRAIKAQRLARQAASYTGHHNWAAVAQCESTSNWHVDHGMGPRVSGGLQIADSTWAAHDGLKYGRRAMDATPSQQIRVAEDILAKGGPMAWPHCHIFL